MQEFFLVLTAGQFAAMGGNPPVWHRVELDGFSGLFITHDKIDEVLSRLGLAADCCEETTKPGCLRLTTKVRGRGRPRKLDKNLPVNRPDHEPAAALPELTISGLNADGTIESGNRVAVTINNRPPTRAGRIGIFGIMSNVEVVGGDHVDFANITFAAPNAPGVYEFRNYGLRNGVTVKSASFTVIPARISKNKYVEVCSKSIVEKKKALTLNIKRQSDEVARLNKELVAALRRVPQMESELLSLNGNELNGRYEQEYDRLLSSPKIKYINVENEVIHIFTKTLVCKDPRTNIVHDIGEFDIHIPIGGGELIWKNMTRTVDTPENNGMHAPHVGNRGSACLGNVGEILPDLIAKYEIAAIASIAIQFVESVNTDDTWGKNINKWPVAKVEV